MHFYHTNKMYSDSLISSSIYSILKFLQMLPKCFLQLICLNQNSINVHLLHMNISLHLSLFLSFSYFVYLPQWSLPPHLFHGIDLLKRPNQFSLSLLRPKKQKNHKTYLCIPFQLPFHLLQLSDTFGQLCCLHSMTFHSLLPIPMRILPTVVTALTESPMTSTTLNPQDTFQSLSCLASQNIPLLYSLSCFKHSLASVKPTVQISPSLCFAHSSISPVSSSIIT